MAKQILSMQSECPKGSFCFACCKSFYFLNVVPVLFDFSCCFSSSQGIGTDGCVNTLSCDETNLNESSTFFLEYVLEDSNDADYFMKHVVGFTFSSSKDDPDNSAGSMDTTVWFSNRVSLLPCSLNLFCNFCSRIII